MSKTAWAVVIAAFFTVVVALNPPTHAENRSNPAARATQLSASTTKAVQAKLASYGYTIAVDGDYGPQTTHVVEAWQKANGLDIDGIVGPATLNSLNLSPGASSARRLPVTPSPAVRVPSPAPTEPGVPDCAEMSALRQAVGLPEIFDHLGYRESNCRNDVISSIGCCVGYWQLHKVIFNDNRMIPLVEACGATWLNIRGNDADSKQRQACMAKALYDTVGMTPWAL